MKKALVALLLVACIPSTTTPQGIAIKNGFMSGAQYLHLSDAGKETYAMGVIDGMLLAPLLGAPKSETTWLENCVTGMSGEQVAAILTKFLQDHPERWHEGMHGLTYSAMLSACTK